MAWGSISMTAAARVLAVDSLLWRYFFRGIATINVGVWIVFIRIYCRIEAAADSGGTGNRGASRAQLSEHSRKWQCTCTCPWEQLTWSRWETRVGDCVGVKNRTNRRKFVWSCAIALRVPALPYIRMQRLYQFYKAWKTVCMKSKYITFTMRSPPP